MASTDLLNPGTKRARSSRSILAQFSLQPWCITAVGALAAAVVLGCTGAAMYQYREWAVGRIRERSNNLATVVADSIGMRIDVYDRLLRDMVAEAENPRTPLLPERVRHEIEFGATLLGEPGDEAYIVDESGKAGASTDVRFSQSGYKGHLTVFDRDYFFVHAGNPVVGLFVSTPFFSRAKAGKPRLALSRRLNKPDGTFAGVAMLAVTLDYFRQAVAKIDSRVNGRVLVVREDGSLVSCNECGHLAPGMTAAPPDVVAALREPLGIQREYAPQSYISQRVRHTSLFVVAQPPVEAVLADWRRNALMLGVATVLFSAWIAGSAWILARAFRAKQAARAELLALSLTDGLTGLSNRRAFDAKLEEEWQAAQRTCVEISLLFIDVDRFKMYNDRHGHAVGDEVLRKVATCIGAHVRRRSDMAARYGGEEFAVILPATPLSGAVALAEKIRLATQDLEVENTDSETGTLTVSIGCATALPIVGTTEASLLGAADAQLLLAKESGRNRVRSQVVDFLREQLPADVLKKRAGA